MQQRAWPVALGFGLLHGFGFAGALRELGVPSNQLIEALGAFNLGVEFGQLTFVLLLTLAARALAGPLRAHTPAGRHLVAYGLGTTATLWVVQRSLQLGV